MQFGTGTFEEMLVRDFVESVLNHHDQSLIDYLFSERYTDHDPLRIPGLLEPGAIGTIDDLKKSVCFLSFSEIDFHFTLEDLFSVGNKVAYRLFGDGTLKVVVDGNANMDARNENSSISRFRFSASEQWVGSLPLGSLLGNSLHVAYDCSGIFHVQEGKLATHWGTAKIS